MRDDGKEDREEDRADKQGGEEDTDVERLVLGLRATAKAEAEVVPPHAIAPLSAAERGEIVAAILSAPTTGRATREISGVTSLAAVRRRRARWLAVVAPVAVAAGIALVLAVPSRRGPAFAPLPAYDVSALGGLKEVRGGAPVPTVGATAAVERVARDTELTIRLRPATAVDGALAVRAFLVANAGVADATAANGRTSSQELGASVELAPSGAAEIHVRPGAAAAAGRAIVRVLVGRPEDVRAATPADATGAPANGNGRQWLTVPIDVLN
jgi:hypothetical protein